MYKDLELNVGESSSELALISLYDRKIALHLSCAWEYGRNPSNETTLRLGEALHNILTIIK